MRHEYCAKAAHLWPHCWLHEAQLLLTVRTMLSLFVLLVVGCAYHSKGVVPARLQFVAIVLAAFKETIPLLRSTAALIMMIP